MIKTSVSKPLSLACSRKALALICFYRFATGPVSSENRVLDPYFPQQETEHFYAQMFQFEALHGKITLWIYLITPCMKA